MNVLKMALTGDNSVGWTWRVWVDDHELLRTHPLAGPDLGAALFSIGRDEARQNPFFRDVPDDDLFLILDEFFFGSLYDALRASAEEQTWARHRVCPTIPAIVSSRMYLIGSRGGPDRLLVSRDGVRHNFRLAPGSFDEALREVVERLDAGMGTPPGAT
jgi:hypothetical protein